MRRELFSSEGRFYKANLHSHSTISDGHLTPVEMRDFYRAHGYSILAVTDHEIMRDHTALSLPDFLMINGYEVYVREWERSPGGITKTCHLNLIAKTPDVRKQVAVDPKYMEMAPVFHYEHLKPLHERYGILPGIGKMHHFAGDYQIGLDLGYGGLLRKVRRYAAMYPEQQEFYTAEEDVIIGIQSWIRRTVAQIVDMMETEADPELRENLREMYEANSWLVENAPRNFREVCQWLAWNNMAERTYCRAGAGGQLDELLRPYYERDLAEGKIDRDKAVYIIACLLINDPHYYQLAGPAADGHDMTSELSFMILEAVDRLNTSCNVTIRVHDGLDERLFRYGVEILLRNRKASPRFSGDKALVAGFMRNGYSRELARRRIAVGCNWMSLPGLEYTMNDLIKINFAKVFEVAYQEYSASTREKSAQGLYGLFLEHLKRAIRCVAEGIDFHLANQYLNAPELMLNLISHGPIEKGRDASHGGMEYYNIAVDGSGLATVADSFAALEQRVERDHALTWQQIYEAVRRDFTGPEDSRIRCLLQGSPRFGTGGSLGDVWAQQIARDFTGAITERRTPNGVLMIPGLFSWANTMMFGKMVGATPNGRKAGEPISHGANPHPGFRKDGALTALSTAVASVQCGFGNTAPLQLELDPAVASQENAAELLGAVIKTHFDLGGTLINVNIVDKEELLAAHRDPMLHPDLVVRVTGFTAYFVTLSPEFRQLIVDRVITDG
ncbi:MAG: formate acetyltransferase [Clostridia bacterium]|nr:formate acetyltransferase [Clostridia bacterium]